MRYWKRTNPDETTRAVESYSHNLDVDGAIEITREEYDAYIASLPPPPPPPEPLVFTSSPPGTAIGQRLNNIEDFLERAYPG